MKEWCQYIVIRTSSSSLSRRAVDGAAADMGDSSNASPAHSDHCSATQSAKQDAGCSGFNKHIFHQDPEADRLSLLPVRVRAPQSQSGLGINPSLVPHLFLGVVPVPENSDQHANGPNILQHEDDARALPCFKGSAVVSHVDSNDDSGFIKQKDPAKQNSSPTCAQAHPALMEVIRLLKGGFSSDGYLDTGHEDVVMGT